MPITQNKKFAFLSNILRKKSMTKLIFLHAGKHENLKRIDTMILMEMVKHFESSSCK